MNRKKEFKPILLPPREFWRIYFQKSIAVASRHPIPRASRGLMALDQVFGNLTRNCLAHINEDQANIEFHGCKSINRTELAACDAHMGAILGVLEITHNKNFKIKQDIQEEICYLSLEKIDD